MLANRVGAKPHEFNMTKYRVSLLLRAIELGVSAGTIASPNRAN